MTTLSSEAQSAVGRAAARVFGADPALHSTVDFRSRQGSSVGLLRKLFPAAPAPEAPQTARAFTVASDPSTFATTACISARSLLVRERRRHVRCAVQRRSGGRDDIAAFAALASQPHAQGPRSPAGLHLAGALEADRQAAAPQQ